MSSKLLSRRRFFGAAWIAAGGWIVGAHRAPGLFSDPASATRNGITATAGRSRTATVDIPATGTSAATQTGPIDETLQRLGEVVSPLLDEHQVPGAAVGIVDGTEIADGGFGVKNVHTGDAVDENTVFEAASLSKPAFAWVVLGMEERGEIDLDAPLVGYAHPERLPSDPRTERVTARLVLRHSSGFPNWARRGPLEFRFDPGDRFGYSGEAYVWLQAGVEQILGAPLEEIMRARLFEPLGMSASHYVWVPDYERSAAVGHTPIATSVRKMKPEEANAAASLHTTAGDYCSFLRALLTDSSGRAERMLALATEIDSNLSWGLGWGLERWQPATGGADLAFWHWGDNGIFKAFVAGSRARGEAVVLFTNGENGLRMAEPVVETVLPGEHPAFRFGMLDY